MVGSRRVDRVGGPERAEEGGDGDPGQEEVSLAHVDVDPQNVVAAAGAAAVVDEVEETPVVEERNWEDEPSAARVSIGKR